MLEIKTEIVIEANLENVWKTLTNFNDYKNWNSFITDISGSLTEGSVLSVHINPPGEKPDKFMPRLLKVAEPVELRWVGVFMFPLLFRGEHYFQLKKISQDKTLFIHGEIFTGLLIPFAAKKLTGNVKKGFEKMNIDLAKKCTSNEINQ